MLLDLHEARVAVAALQTLERALADEIEDSAEDHSTHVPEESRAVLDRHEHIATLIKKLATAGEHRVDKLEVGLIVAGIERYVPLLEEPPGTHCSSDDFLVNPDPSARQAERKRGTNLYEKLTGHGLPTR